MQWTSLNAAVCLVVLYDALCLGMSKNIPHDVKLCSATDPHINNCFRHAANRMLKHLEKGLPAVGWSALDPLTPSTLELRKGNAILPALEFTVKDSVHRGCKHAFIRKATVNPRKYSFDLEMTFPYYNVTGKYNVDGTIMGFLPINGTGPFTITSEHDTLKIKVKGTPVKQKDQLFMNVDTVQVNAHIGRMTFDMHGLFGNAVMSNVTNKLLNRYSKTLSRNIIPAANFMLEKIYGGMIRQFFRTVPYDNLFHNL